MLPGPVDRQTRQGRPGTLGERERLGMPDIGLQPVLQRLGPGVVECIVSEQHRPFGGGLTDAPLLRILANHAHSGFSL